MSDFGSPAVDSAPQGGNTPPPSAPSSVPAESPSSGQSGRESQGGSDTQSRPSGGSASDTMGLDKSPSDQQQTPGQTWKFKANGRDVELSDPKEVEKYLSMGYDANNKWQESAAQRKQNEQFLRAFRDDPVSVLMNPQLGLDAQAIAMQILQSQIDDALLTPEQKQQREMQKELETFRSQKTQAEQAAAAERQQKADREWEQSTSAEVKSHLKQSGLPHTKFTWNSTLQYMAQAYDAGYENVTPQDVMPYVKRDYQQAQAELYSLPEEELLSHIGEANINRIQQAVIKKAKGGSPSRPTPQPQSQQPRGQHENSMSEEEWKASIRQAIARDQGR